MARFSFIKENKKNPNPSYTPPASILKDDSMLKFDYVFTEGFNPRSEYEVKKKIISEFEKLRSDKPGSINTISIDYAIEIVNMS